MKRGKKGLSAVVTTLLIILLAIVLIGIVWVVVRNVIVTGSEDVNLEQLTLDLSIQSAYVDSTAGGDIKVGVRRSAGTGDITGVRFVFFDGTESISIDRVVSLEPAESRVFAFDIVNDVPGIEAGDEVSVVPLFETQTGQQKVARTTDSREISGEIPEGGGGVGDYENDTGDTGDTGTVGGSCVDDLDCSTGEICSDGTCIIPVTPDSCDGTWNQTDIDDGNECDGGTDCTASCACPTGYSGDGSGGCLLNDPINEGQIFSVWPEDKNAQRFQSADLPKSQSELLSYTSYYVNFSVSGETRCFRIQSATYFSDINMSEVGLLINTEIENLANISVAQWYHIWEAENCGL